MRSAVQNTLLASLAAMLRPIISLTLKCGLGSHEFTEVARSVFISVASDEYGVRGRPTNISRVAALTGISRKEIRKLREGEEIPTQALRIDTSPASTVLHHWHHDPAFNESAGFPKPLPQTGDDSFSELVGKYGGDIPVGAMKTELQRAGVIVEDRDNRVVATRRYLHPETFNEEFVKTVAFAIQNFATTIAHNANLLQSENYSDALNEEYGRFERFAWANHLNAADMEAFRSWVRAEGTAFVERADHWIGERETPIDERSPDDSKTIGVGVYYFEDDS